LLQTALGAANLRNVQLSVQPPPDHRDWTTGVGSLGENQWLPADGPKVCSRLKEVLLNVLKRGKVKVALTP
jgi:hypothetical protein